MLTNRERIILMALEDSGGLNAKQLARHLTLSPRYLRRLTGNLYHAGLIEQTHAANEGVEFNPPGKPSLYRITEYGKAQLDAIQAAQD